MGRKVFVMPLIWVWVVWVGLWTGQPCFETLRLKSAGCYS